MAAVCCEVPTSCRAASCTAARFACARGERWDEPPASCRAGQSRLANPTRTSILAVLPLLPPPDVYSPDPTAPLYLGVALPLLPFPLRVILPLLPYYLCTIPPLLPPAPGRSP